MIPYTCTSSLYTEGLVHIVALHDGPVRPLCRTGVSASVSYLTTSRTATCSKCLAAWREVKR